MTVYRTLRDKAAPSWPQVASNQYEATLQRLHNQLVDAEDELIRVTERGQKLAAVHGRANGQSEAELDRRYNISGGEGL